MYRDRKKDRDLDILLSYALKQHAEPDEALKRKVLRQWKERQEMRKNKKWTIAAAVATCVLAVTVSVGAAGHYLNSRQVAEQFDMDNMAKAFSQGDGIEINQTQSWGGYNVTLMGVASGENLSWAGDGAQQPDGSKTYAIVAIERGDGTPMPDGTDDAAVPEEFFISPLIKGYNPVNFNAMTMDGAASWKVIDGVRYQLVECDNVEIFADQGLYLCVMNTMMYDMSAYGYDPATGVIAPNGDYEGMNLLFDLPLDVSRADSQKVKEYLRDFEIIFPDADKQGAEKEPESDSESDSDSDAEQQLISSEYVDYIRSGEWKKEAAVSDRVIDRTAVEKTANGGYELPYCVSLEDGTEMAGTMYFSEADFVDGTAVQKISCGSSESVTDYRMIFIAEKDVEGNVTIRAYVQSGAELE